MASFPVFLAETAHCWVGTVIWAAVVVLFLVLFRTQIAAFLGKLSGLKIKAKGFEVSFETKQEKAVDSLTNAVENKTRSVGVPEMPDRNQIVQTVHEAAPPTEAERFSRSQVLWVDDQPDNNIYERKAFEAIGLRFTLARSTEEAQAILESNSFAAIISDMDRPPDQRAGYTLLDELRERDKRTPFIIYSGSDAPAYKTETLEHGGYGNTNRPDELFRLVTKAITEGANR